MQIAVLSDIHANYPALEAVLKHAKRQGAERLWFLGDIVGYGPHPGQCLDWLRADVADGDWVLGNHDAMLLGLEIRERWHGDELAHQRAKEQNYFAFRELSETEEPKQEASYDPLAHIDHSEIAQAEAEKTKEAIAALRLNLDTLATHPAADAFWRTTFDQTRLGPKCNSIDGVEHWLVHASRLDSQQLGPYIYPWATYLIDTEVKELQSLFAAQPESVCQWHGHTHVPYLATLNTPQLDGHLQPICVEIGRPYPLGKSLTLANPGSVGQPRNGDRRACYAMLDTEVRTITFYRVRYDWEKTKHDLTRGGYPNGVVWRLSTAEVPSGEDEPPDECKKCLARQREESDPS